MRRVAAAAIVMLPAAAFGGDYFGILRVPPSLNEGTTYAFESLASPGFSQSTADSRRFKLGYRYSRNFAVEADFSDYARPVNPFENPTSLGSPFRSTGFGMNAVATLPFASGFALYGRAGAYRGERNGPIALAGALPLDPNHGTRWRYGLGLRYDFSKSLGVLAEIERHSANLGNPLAGDIDTDQVTLGVSWRW